MPTRIPTGLSYVKPGANSSTYVFTAGDVTPNVSKGTYWVCDNSAVTITNFDGGERGQVIIVQNNGGSTVLQHSAGGIFFSSSATNLTMTSNMCLQFVNDGTQWIEIRDRV